MYAAPSSIARAVCSARGVRSAYTQRKAVPRRGIKINPTKDGALWGGTVQRFGAIRENAATSVRFDWIGFHCAGGVPEHHGR